MIFIQVVPPIMGSSRAQCFCFCKAPCYVSIDHFNDLLGVIGAFHPVGIAASSADLLQCTLLQFSQMTARQLALYSDEPAFIADDDVRNAGGAVKPSVFLPEENVLSQGRQVSLNGRDDITFKQMDQLLLLNYGK